MPYNPAAAEIEVIEPKNIVGRSFERVFVLGMAEGSLPRPASEDPVIDFFERGLLAEHPRHRVCRGGRGSPLGGIVVPELSAAVGRERYHVRFPKGH